jgi:hypothetical protein
MSFNSNDINNTIHLGNYEEFFILYIDNELSDKQMKMVDEFLIKYPHLQSELDILCTTKLPAEEVSFNKECLFADHMKLNIVDEDLLLYIDNELPADKKLAIEEQIASDKNAQLQYQALLYTKLDAADTIAYPNKEELYRRTEKVVAFRMWMRVAAVILLIGALGLAYWMSSSSSSSKPQPFAVKKNTSTAPVQTPVVSPAINEQSNEQTVATTEPRELQHPSYANTGNESNEQKQKNTVENQSLIASNNENNKTPDENIVPTERPASTIDTKLIASVDVNTDLVNNPSVTYTAPERTTIIDNQTTVDPTPEPSDNRKGSLKGLLRRATRVIEKRTGIDPTNGGDELLIGAVAVKLK